MRSSSLQPLLVARVVEAMAALRAAALGQEAELLVVAHGARRRANAAGELSDTELFADCAHDGLLLNRTYT